MSYLQKILALTAGVIFASGWLAISGVNLPTSEYIIIAVAYAAAITATLIQKPERISWVCILVIASLLVVLTLWIAVHNPEKLISTAAWSLSFIASLVAFLRCTTKFPQSKNRNHHVE
ncbi:hypothetical protein JIN85_14380 [Luteolibacter pohnpeiensis]|uniref:Uncharacterized protein n=2 Tax=Luteolibacter pohnpeiensis TaxID=454153 RepID=A0A934S9Z3_9BACT|nr:hypothetical protein [Luteolibacter pohnpeiensis]